MYQYEKDDVLAELEMYADADFSKGYVGYFEIPQEAAQFIGQYIRELRRRPGAREALERVRAWAMEKEADKSMEPDYHYAIEQLIKVIDNEISRL